MTRLLVACFGVLFACCATSSPGGNGWASYPLEELLALDQQEAWNEVLAHALEVAPTRRDASWQKALDRAANGKLATLEVTDAASAERALSTADELMHTYPSLAKSAAYHAKRAEVAVASFGWLSDSRQSYDWVHRIQRFAEKDTTTPHLAQRLANEVVGKRLIAGTTIGLFELALARDGAKVCDEPMFVKGLVDALVEGASAETKQLATKTCWGSVKGPLLEVVKGSESRTVLLRLCPLYAGQPEADAIKAKCPN